MSAPISMDRFVNLTIGNVSYVGPLSLTQFSIEQPKMMMASPKYLVVKLSFNRLFIYHMFASFAPSLLLMIVTQVMLFVDYDEHFDTTVMVHLTTMLVMYTLYASTSNSMPNTAYLKFIDICLLVFCLFCRLCVLL